MPALGLRLPPKEVALAAVVGVVMAADSHAARWPALAVVLCLAAGATLVVRRRLPLLPIVAIGSVNLLLMGTSTDQYGPQTVVLGMLFALYSAATQLAGRAALVAGAVGLVLVWSAHAASPDGDLLDFFPPLEWGVPWVAGRLVRRQTLQAHEAGARAALLEVEARNAAAVERDRIARELHDVVGHAVSLMVVQAGAARMALGTRAAPTRAALESIEESGRQALVELRAMLGVLRDTSETDERTPAPTLQSLPDLVEQVRRAGLPVSLAMPTDAEAPPGLALTVYRLVQEALTNALRHAGAVETAVSVELADDVTVRVSNALPSDAVAGRDGRGLVGMRERVTLHGGTFSAGPEGSSWVVAARLPLAART
jgi:signal transduction histidine kinase